MQDTEIIIFVKDKLGEFGVPPEWQIPVFGLSACMVFYMLSKKLVRITSQSGVLESMVTFTLGKLNYMVESNYFPDWLIRIGIRALLSSRLNSLPTVNVEAQ